MAILIRRDLLNMKIIEIKNEENLKNRLIHIQIETNETINIINLYAPAKGYLLKKNFYQDIKNYLNQYNKESIFLLGDFNYVQEQNDRLSTKFQDYDIMINKIFNNLEFKIHDIFRLFYPNKIDFTYTNSRIDRIYISEHLLSNIKTVRHMDKITDHKIVLLELEMGNFKKWGNSYWKLNNGLLNDDFYKIKIKEILKQQHNNDTIENWEIIKETIKRTSKKISNQNSKIRKLQKDLGREMLEKFKNKTAKDIIRKAIQDIKQYEFQGNTVRSKNLELDQIYRKGKELNRKTEFRKGNSKFIHTINGKQNEQEIMTEIENFYTELYTSQNISDTVIDKYLKNFNPPILNEQEKNNLGEFITQKEIETAINQLNENKSPGHDGLTPEFYKTFRTEISPILALVYNNILLKNELPKSMTLGLITLIYKNKGENSNLKNWRPISLLNLDYKILTKILTNRLKNNANNLINKLQSCRPGKASIIDNALNLRTIIDYVENENQYGAIISLDQEKAFDRVEHNFLYKVLQKFNFPNNILSYVNIFTTNIKSKIIINGKLSKSIKIERSVRQGCPLSMYLYAFSLEPLIYYINQNKNIVGISIPNYSQQIKTIQHADDTSALVSSEMSYTYLMDEYKHYSKISGAKINNDKTEILKIGKWKDKQILPIHLIKKYIKIFGIIFGQNDQNINFENILKKIQLKIDQWENSKINIIQKIIVIKTYIASIFHYTMTINDIPYLYKLRINSIIYKFIWNGRDKLSRETMQQNINNGGLSMLDIHSKQKTIHIQRFKSFLQDYKKPWTSLYIYWFGLYFKTMCPTVASNQYVHTIKIPEKIVNIKNTLLNYKNDNLIWQYKHFKQINNYIISKEKFKPKIMFDHPDTNWNITWKIISQIKNINYKIIMFKYIHRILPTPEYLYKFKILKDITNCEHCKVPINLDHIFQKCELFNNEREFLKNQLLSIQKNIIINKQLYETLNNPTIKHENEQKIVNIMIQYIIQIWDIYQAIKP